MSMPIPVEEKCYVCENISQQIVLASTNQFGSPDLDLRPPEMARSTMEFWIQVCPHCGYVAASLGKRTFITAEWLQREEYTSCENRNFKSKLAEKFYKWYMINCEVGDIEEAFHAVLHAAWACDDVEDLENAVDCRKKAIVEIDKLIERRKEEELMVIRADLLRRSKQFDLLIKEYQDIVLSEELLNQIIKFQIEKAKQLDVCCYRVRDVIQ